MEYDIPIYMTKTAKENVGLEARDRAAFYLEDAINEKQGRSVNIIKPSTFPEPPIQDCYQSFTDEDWAGFGTRTYSCLGQWIHVYTENKAVPHSEDAVLLLTDVSSTAHGKTWKVWSNEEEPAAGAGIGGAEYLPALNSDSATRYRGTTAEKQAFDAMNTVLHEVGHCLLTIDDFNEHRTGEITKNPAESYREYKTPMGLNGEKTNACGWTYNTHPSNVEHQLWYSNCCEGEWKDPASTW
jgi:hypothetical protein